ncbi:MAG TPA: serine/threonine-protein kinase [Kofleriaceae bacterium]|nr:serine/threonine-protein kinase [Kofleriaceae bacterium]
MAGGKRGNPKDPREPTQPSAASHFDHVDTFAEVPFVADSTDVTVTRPNEAVYENTLVDGPGGTRAPRPDSQAAGSTDQILARRASSQAATRVEPSPPPWSGNFRSTPSHQRVVPRSTSPRPPTELTPSRTTSRFARPPEIDGPLVGGRYQMVRRISEGGMGKIFEVSHARLGKVFALKIIHHNFAGQTKARDLFYREARLASSLSHPNIVSVVDFGEDETLGAFMVMEYLEGRPLSSILRREQRLGVRAACEIMLQVAEALHYIHARNIVHCDIKAENILVCELPGAKRRRQIVKLLDFGLARSTSSVRNTSTLSGTPHYVAPERIRGERAGPQSDIYGLGILFYELVTGKVPWSGPVSKILAHHIETPPVPPSRRIKDGLDPAPEQLILRALEKDPRNRHKDMAAFIYELHTVMDMLGFGKRNRGGQTKIVRRPESRRDELIRGMFEAHRLPMALIDADGQILVANAAFAKFVMGVTTEVENLNVNATPLAGVWQSFPSDLAQVISGAHVRRVISVGNPGEERRLLMWLDPDATAENAIFGVHPLDE